MAKKILQEGILTHLFFICLFLIIPALAFVRPPGEPFFAITRIFVQDTTASFVLLCFFYLNYYVLIPGFFIPRKYALYFLCTAGFLSVALTLPFFAGKLFAHAGPSISPFRPEPGGYAHTPFVPTSIVAFVFDEFRRHLALFFTAVFFSFLLRTREHLAQLKAEKLHAELNTLKSQINPHFLFNTLNSIYTLTVKKDDRAGEAVIHLSGLMRYAIKDANDDKIPLQEEVGYITHYIELQKVRLGNTANIRYTISGEPGQKRIAPLILITYIENTFKYGVNPNIENCVVEINLQMSATGLRLQTFNKKAETPAHAVSTGIGLKNTRERLMHLYPGKHCLDISENDETYSVTLTLNLL